MKKSTLERFMLKVAQGQKGCVFWTAATDGKGYGLFWDGRLVRAHRWAYEYFKGPIPEGLQLDHLCRNRNCVNPAHLEPVTQRENLLRGTTLSAANFAKTHCPQGHPYSGANLYVKPNGGRDCRKCVADSLRRSRARKKTNEKGSNSSPSGLYTN